MTDLLAVHCLSLPHFLLSMLPFAVTNPRKQLLHAYIEQKAKSESISELIFLYKTHIWVEYKSMTQQISAKLGY